MQILFLNGEMQSTQTQILQVDLEVSEISRASNFGFAASHR